MMSEVSINLNHCQYVVMVKNGVFLNITDALKKKSFLTKKCAVITDENVGFEYLSKFESLLNEAGVTSTAHQIKAGEASKSMAVVSELCSDMIQQGHDRQSLVIALGGGVVGDIAGFVSAIFYRGIPFVQIPTTIVSQVDSSVGGKTGVNTPEGKNLIGAFHQPALVIIDPQMLKTLPAREYREGYAEVIKHACIRDADMIADLEQLPLFTEEGAVIPPHEELLIRNISIKARVVEEDEKETFGTRALLNFGHTIGHGIEASVPYGELLHGEAISLGMRAALWLSVKHASLSQAEADRIISLLAQYELPIVLSESIKTGTIVEKMMTDKKFSAGKINFILLNELGRAFVSSDLTMDHLVEAIEAIRKSI